MSQYTTINTVPPLSLDDQQLEAGDTAAFINKMNALQAKLQAWSSDLSTSIATMNALGVELESAETLNQIALAQLQAVLTFSQTELAEIQSTAAAVQALIDATNGVLADSGTQTLSDGRLSIERDTTPRLTLKTLSASEGQVLFSYNGALRAAIAGNSGGNLTLQSYDPSSSTVAAELLLAASGNIEANTALLAKAGLEVIGALALGHAALEYDATSDELQLKVLEDDGATLAQLLELTREALNLNSGDLSAVLQLSVTDTLLAQLEADSTALEINYKGGTSDTTLSLGDDSLTANARVKVIDRSTSVAGAIDLHEARVNGTRWVTLRAPAQIAASHEYRLPAEGPTSADQVLTATSTAGAVTQLEWQSPPSATARFCKSGSTDTNGNVNGTTTLPLMGTTMHNSDTALYTVDSGSSRITVNESGWYRCTATVCCDTTTSSVIVLEIHFRVNGVDADSYAQALQIENQYGSCQLTDVLYIGTGQYVDVRVNRISGSSTTASLSESKESGVLLEKL